jgi:hypothetical protein
MKYNIIGDTHHHIGWKKIVDEDAINIFVGDYFDCFAPFSFKQKKEHFDELIKFKKKHPETILLFGNHDFLQYYKDFGECSGFQQTHAKAYRHWIEENKELFQMAYSIENKYLVTHAGVTKDWYEKYFPKQESYTPDEVAKNINDIYEEQPTIFKFSNNSWRGDIYGTSPTQSCLWVRPSTLMEYNIFKNDPYVQIVGHTIYNDILEWKDGEQLKAVVVDCLQNNLISYKIDTEK